MRCPECRKFASYDDSTEPDINSENIDNDGKISIDARIVLTCADCGTELKEAEFNLETNMPDEIVELHKGDDHYFELEISNQELTTKSGNFKKGVFVPAYGGYAKTFYGVNLTVEVKCKCQKQEDPLLFSVDLEDDIQASSMEELS